eukprot:3541839-Pleurochrysis_carterae.AAC.3
MQQLFQGSSRILASLAWRKGASASLKTRRPAKSRASTCGSGEASAHRLDEEDGEREEEAADGGAADIDEDRVHARHQVERLGRRGDVVHLLRLAPLARPRHLRHVRKVGNLRGSRRGERSDGGNLDGLMQARRSSAAA